MLTSKSLLILLLPAISNLIQCPDFDLKNERKIQVSLVDLAADCVFWLSGQTHERETSAVLAGIDQFGKKNEKWSLKVLHNFSECLLECLKDYVLPESDECISNARGHAGHLFGVSQEGLKQTQRAAEKLTLLTLREAKKLESLSPFNPEPEHATNSEESGEGSDVDSDEDLIMSD